MRASNLLIGQVGAGANSELARIRRTPISVLLNVNNANTDILSWSGLPAKLRIRKIEVLDPVGTLTLATLSAYTALAAGGTLLVSAFALSALTTGLILDATLAGAIANTVITSGLVVLRNVTAAGGAATISAVLEYEDLTQ